MHMRAEVKRGTEPEAVTSERCHIVNVANDSGDDMVSIARARVEPGVTTAWHKLRGIPERYIIVSGKGRVEVEGMEPAEVASGDVVRIPADTPQRITNTGETDLIFYCICTPPFQWDCYESME